MVGSLPGCASRVSGALSMEEGRRVRGELPGGGAAWAKDRGSAILGVVASRGRRGRVSHVGGAREGGLGKTRGEEAV